MMTDVARDMHADFASLAESMIEQHLEQDDGEKCFNLHTYLDALTNRIDELLNDSGAWGDERGRFSLDCESIARYLWACVAIKSEGRAYPDHFRGMPILD